MNKEKLLLSAGSMAFKHGVKPALELLGEKYVSSASAVLLLAIGFQESRFKYRQQVNGPAHGFWQFEQGGGVKGVLQHHSTAEVALRVCASLKYSNSTDEVYQAIKDNDVLAAAFARLLLWSNPKPLPQLDDVDGAWDYYVNTWRPGKPHPETWAECYALAVKVFADYWSVDCE